MDSAARRVYPFVKMTHMKSPPSSGSLSSYDPATSKYSNALKKMVRAYNDHVDVTNFKTSISKLNQIKKAASDGVRRPPSSNHPALICSGKAFRKTVDQD